MDGDGYAFSHMLRVSSHRVAVIRWVASLTFPECGDVRYCTAAQALDEGGGVMVINSCKHSMRVQHAIRSSHKARQHTVVACHNGDQRQASQHGARHLPEKEIPDNIPWRCAAVAQLGHALQLGMVKAIRHRSSCYFLHRHTRNVAPTKHQSEEVDQLRACSLRPIGSCLLQPPELLPAAPMLSNAGWVVWALTLGRHACGCGLEN